MHIGHDWRDFVVSSKGDASLNVPIYNGGLFDTQNGSFLLAHKIPDPFLAEAIELLTIDHDSKYPLGVIPFIDYSSLDVRHLGDIYEGLLEFQLQIAEEDVYQVREKGKSVWKKSPDVKRGIW
jgi:hypothetical protein